MFLNNIHAVTQNTEPNSILLPDGLLYSQKILSLSPSYIWPLWETSGLVMEDIVSTYDGSYSGVTLNNTTPPAPSMRTAGLWDGVNDYGEITSVPISGAEFSIGLWVKVANAGVWTDGAYRVLTEFRVDASNRLGIYKDAVNNILRMYCIAGGASIDSPTTFSSTSWNLLMLTRSETNDRLRKYIAGVQQGADISDTGTFSGTTATIQVGRRIDGLYYSGWLSFLMYFPRELTPAEVAICATAS